MSHLKFKPGNEMSVRACYRRAGGGRRSQTTMRRGLPRGPSPLSHTAEDAVSADQDAGLAPDSESCALPPAGHSGTSGHGGAATPVAPSLPEALLGTGPQTGLLADVAPLLCFALPTLCISVTSPLLSLVDTSVVGLASSAQLAAMAPATVFSDGLAYTLTFLPMAVTNLVALYMDQKDLSSAGKVVSEALALAAAIACAITAILLSCAPHILAAVAQLPPDTLETAASYVRWRSLGLPCAVGYSVMQAYFLACQAPAIPMLATAITGAVNLVGDLILCQGLHMGATGAAIATAGANWVVFLLMLHWLQRPLPQSSPYAGLIVPVQVMRPHISVCMEYLRISGPILGAILVKVLFFGAVSARAAELGAAAAAAHQILFSLALFFAVFGDTVCQAAQAFVPPRIGTPDSAWRLATALMMCGVMIALFNGAAGAIASTAGLSAFTANSEVACAVHGVRILFVAVVMLHCCSMSTEGILLAARDSGFLCGAYLVTVGMLKILLDYLLAAGFGLAACWVTIVVFHVLRLVANGSRLLRPGSVLSQTKRLPARLCAQQGSLTGRDNQAAGAA